MASNFVVLWPTDPKFSSFEDLILFSNICKGWEAIRILRIGFALSKCPHLLHKMGFVDSLTHTTVQPCNWNWRRVMKKKIRNLNWYYLWMDPKCIIANHYTFLPFHKQSHFLKISKCFLRMPTKTFSFDSLLIFRPRLNKTEYPVRKGLLNLKTIWNP